MTVHTHFEALDQLPRIATLHISGVGNTSSDMTSVKGCASIVHTGTGLYTVTLNRIYKGGLIGLHHATLTSATAANFDVVLTGSTVETDGKFTIACLSSASNSANAPIIADRLTTDTLLLTVFVQDTASKPSGRV